MSKRIAFGEAMFADEVTSRDEIYLYNILIAPFEGHKSLAIPVNDVDIYNFSIHAEVHMPIDKEPMA